MTTNNTTVATGCEILGCEEPARHLRIRWRGFRLCTGHWRDVLTGRLTWERSA